MRYRKYLWCVQVMMKLSKEAEKVFAADGLSIPGSEVMIGVLLHPTESVTGLKINDRIFR